MLTFAWYVVILLAVGAVSAGRAFAEAPRWPKRLTTLAWGSVSALCVVIALRLWSQTYDAFGGEQPLELAHAQVILFETPWGGGWLWQAGAAAVALIAVLVWRRSWKAWPLAAAAVSVAAFTTALTGHAVAMEDRQWMTVLAHGVHVTAAGWWLGGLMAIQLVTLGLDVERDVAGRQSLATVIARFSPIAIAAVTTLVLAGAVATWRHVIEPAGFAGFASPYGLTLLTKVAAFVIAGLCGLYNWRVLTPQLFASAEAARQLRHVAWLEVSLGVVAIVLTALLGTMSMPEPPGGH